MFDKDLKSIYEQKITNLMSDWEAYSGNSNAYNQEDMIYPG